MQSEIKRVVLDVAKHEVGHWLAWHYFGGVSSGVEVTILSVSGRHMGASLPDLDWTMDSLQDAINYIKARLITLHAGIYAQCFMGHDFDADRIQKEFCHLGSAGSDFHKAVELSWVYCNLIGRSDDYQTVTSEISQEAANLIATNFDFIRMAALKISEMAFYEGQIIKIKDHELLSILEEQSTLRGN